MPNNDEDLFADIDIELGVNTEESVKPAEEKPKRGQRAQVIKEPEGTKTIEQLVPEFKNEGLAPGKYVIIEAQNFDHRKTLIDYMREGRIVVDAKDRPYILAEQKSKIYSLNAPPIHKIYIDEIDSIFIRNYWLDLETMPKGKRYLAKEIAWCLHRGFETHSMVSFEQVEMLLANKQISKKQIFYSHSDLSTGGSFYMGNDPSEPSESFIVKKEDERMKTYGTANKISGDEEESVLETDEEDNLVDSLEDIDID